MSTIDKQIEEAYQEYKTIKEESEEAKKKSTLAYNRYKKLAKSRTNSKKNGLVEEKIQKCLKERKDDMTSMVSMINALNFKDIVDNYIESSYEEIEKSAHSFLSSSSLKQNKIAISNIKRRVDLENEDLKLLRNLSNDDILFNLIKNFEMYKPRNYKYGYERCIRCINIVKRGEYRRGNLRNFLPSH